MSNIKDTFAESFQLQISVLHQSICILKVSLSSLSNGWAKHKEKVLDVSVKMLRQHATPKSSLRNLKIFSSKGCKKTSQRFMYVCSHGYVANTAIEELRIFSGRYHFRWWVFPSTVENLRSYKVNDAKPLKNLVVSFYALCLPSQHHHMYVYWRSAHLTGVFKNHADLVLHILGSD